MSQRSLTAALLAGVLLAACSPKTETAAAPAAPAAAPVASSAAMAATAAGAGLSDASTTAEIHNALIRPGSQALFDAESSPPQDEAGWAKLQAAAQQVIAGANMLKTGSRPQGRAEWPTFADKVIAATKITADALAQKKADELVFTDGDMMEGCTGCHEKFRTGGAPNAHPAPPK